MRKAILLIPLVLMLFSALISKPVLAQEETVTPTVTETATPTATLIYELGTTITLGDYFKISAIAIIDLLFLAALVAIVLLLIINPKRGGGEL
jgi:hypothetical protein